ncbi:uncharacterized protein [Miscanthus floridulus]|uniref:uncharacterized protein n=1 Tax=Miscanthus floridulus TaxID=154761 RepID=UPI0034587184
MSCLVPPAKRVWRGIRARLGLRRTTGLGRLRKEVRTCEYSDVHVMWEMLSKPSTTRGSGSGVRDDTRRPTTAGKGAAAKTRPGRAGRKDAAVAAWSRLASYCCAL